MARTALFIILISLPAIILCEDVIEEAADSADFLPEVSKSLNSNILDVNRVFQLSAVVDAANWHRAEQHCVSQKKHLATIMNDADNDKIANLMKRHNIDKIWIGANDLAEEGRWTWVANGFPTNYTSWETSAGQPNGGEHCVSMVKGGYWHDYGCSHKIHFVCE